MSIRKRKIEADYLKVGDKFELIGVGFEGNMGEEIDCTTREKEYVDGSTSSSKTITRWQSDFSEDQIESKSIIEYITSIQRELKTGTDAESEFIKVDTDKQGIGENSYYARKFKVAIQISELYPLDGSFLGMGDPKIGTVIIDPETKEITFTEGFTAKK